MIPAVSQPDFRFALKKKDEEKKPDAVDEKDEEEDASADSSADSSSDGTASSPSPSTD